MVIKDTIDAKKDFANLYCRLCEKNAFMDGKVVYEEILDMKMIYYLRFEIREGEYLSYIVDEKALKRWELSKEELKIIAWENTVRDKMADFFEMSDFLGSFGIQSEMIDASAGKLYILTNQERHNGAIVMFYPGMLAKIGKKLGYDFYVLPSSVHECLILADKGEFRVEELKRIVEEVNVNELEKKDLLSFSVYKYNRFANELEIAE